MLHKPGVVGFKCIWVEGCIEHLLTQTGDESLLVFTACVGPDWWYNNQHSRTNGGTTPHCNMGNIMHNMEAISYWHPSRVNTDTEQKEHTRQPFGSPPSLCHLFSVSQALSWLNSSSRDRPCGRTPHTLTFSNPPTATLEMPQTCTCLWGFIQSRPHTRPLRHDSVCSQSAWGNCCPVRTEQFPIRHSHNLCTIYTSVACVIISTIVQLFALLISQSVVFRIWSIKCQKTVKKPSTNSQAFQLTSSDCSFCQINRPKPQKIQFTMI